jgi:hypothetical protein
MRLLGTKNNGAPIGGVVLQIFFALLPAGFMGIRRPGLEQSNSNLGMSGFSAQILRRVGKTLTPSRSSVMRTSPYFLEKSALTIL